MATRSLTALRALEPVTARRGQLAPGREGLGGLQVEDRPVTDHRAHVAFSRASNLPFPEASSPLARWECQLAEH